VAKAIVKIQAKGLVAFTVMPTPQQRLTQAVPDHQNQEASSSSSIIVFADRLCFVKFQKKTHPDQTKNCCPWWPAILYETTEEFQSHNVLDTSTKMALWTQVMQQHLANAKSGQEPAKRASQSYSVAQLLGRPLKDLLVLRHDDLLQDYHPFLYQILPLTLCQPNVFESADEYLIFHKGLDQAVAILMESSMTTNTNDISFYTLAQKAIKNQDDPEKDPQEP
jgi:hypothetical protein